MNEGKQDDTEKKWGVHERHCCPIHGCKYGDADCPVVTGKTKKHNEYCEDCEIDKQKSLGSDPIFASLTYDEWMALYESTGDEVYQTILKNARARGISQQAPIACPHVCERVCLENVKEHDATVKTGLLEKVCLCNFDVVHFGINEGTVEHVCERSSCIHINEPWVLCKVVDRPVKVKK